MRDVGHPNAAYPEPVRLGSGMDLLPEGFVEFLVGNERRFMRGSPPGSTYLGKAIGMRCQNSHISRLRIRIVYGDVLFYRHVQFLFLLVRCGSGILSDMLAFDDMVDDSEGSAG